MRRNISHFRIQGSQTPPCTIETQFHSIRSIKLLSHVMKLNSAHHGLLLISCDVKGVLFSLFACLSSFLLLCMFSGVQVLVRRVYVPLGATGNAPPLLKIDLAFVSSDSRKVRYCIMKAFGKQSPKTGGCAS